MKEAKKYIWVGLLLFLLTVVTVAARTLNVGLVLAIFIALLIATFKGSLVASFFMHLVSEKKAIYILLLSTTLLFVLMMGLILFGQFDVYKGLKRVP